MWKNALFTVRGVFGSFAFCPASAGLEISLFLQFLLMHQSLATLLDARWNELERLAYDLEYSSVQQLIKVDVLYWLHHADKQGKKLAKEKNLLLKIREVVCDWLGQMPPNPSKEYKLRSKQRGELAVACIQRTVPLSMCQVSICSSF